MRGNLSATSMFIASVSFQALINPPGGFIQQGLLSQGNTTNSSSHALNCTTLNDLHQYCPGQPVSSFRDEQGFRDCVKYLTASFYGSVCVSLLHVSGVPLQNSAAVRFLSLCMLFTLFFLTRAYLTALNFMIPEHLSGTEQQVASLWVFPLTFVSFFVMFLFPRIRNLLLKSVQFLRLSRS